MGHCAGQRFDCVFCCQLPRWIGTLTLYIFGTRLAYELGYMLSLAPLLYVLRRYFAKAAYQAMPFSRRSLLLFGGRITATAPKAYG
ncbi:MAG: hypothetical protein GXW96_02065 [Christensenellaceae bacterium]|nr:hypothetical protein [Christensenellaceae bacterium]